MLLANTEGRKYAEISQYMYAEIRQSTEMSAPSLNPPLAINLSHRVIPYQITQKKRFSQFKS